MTTPGEHSPTTSPPPSDDPSFGGMHVITVRYIDGREVHVPCVCVWCELWRTVDFREMREQYENRMDEWVKSELLTDDASDTKGILIAPGTVTQETYDALGSHMVELLNGGPTIPAPPIEDEPE